MLKEEFTEWANNGGIRSQDSGYISHAINIRMVVGFKITKC